MMTEKEKEILRIFEETLPQMTEEERHDLLVFGKGMATFVKIRAEKAEPPKKAG